MHAIVIPTSGPIRAVDRKPKLLGDCIRTNYFVLVYEELGINNWRATALWEKYGVRDLREGITGEATLYNVDDEVIVFITDKFGIRIGERS